MQGPSHFVCASEDVSQNSKDHRDHCSSCTDLHGDRDDYVRDYFDLLANAGFHDNQHFDHCRRGRNDHAEHDRHND